MAASTALNDGLYVLPDLDEETERELREVESRVVDNFSLSDAIRLGSMSTKQVKGSFGDGVNTACALTAALVGLRKRESAQ